MSSFLSASSSLSGSTQHPNDDDDDDDEDNEETNENLSLSSEDPQHHRFSPSSPSFLPEGFSSTVNGLSIKSSAVGTPGESSVASASDDNSSVCASPSDLQDLHPLSRTSTKNSVNSPVLHGQSREHMTTHQIVQHHTQQQQRGGTHPATNKGSIFRSQSVDPYTFVSRPGSSTSNVSSGNGTANTNINVAGSSTNSFTSSSKRLRFKHYHKPKVTDSPRLVFLCQQFINNGDHESLAIIARRRGLPPKLRRLAWPLLLANHPYVLNPNISVDSMSPPTSKDIVPSRRIANEISRYQKKRQQQHQAKSQRSTLITSSSNTNTISGSSVSSSQLSHMHNHETPGKSPLSASFTAEGTQPSEQPSQSQTNSQQNTAQNHEEIEALRCAVIQEAVENFLSKWGHVTPYEPGMVYVGFALAEWIDLIPSSEETGTIHPSLSAIYNSNSAASSTSQPNGGAFAHNNFAHLNYQSSISSKTSNMSERIDSLPSSPALQANSSPLVTAFSGNINSNVSSAETSSYSSANTTTPGTPTSTGLPDSIMFSLQHLEQPKYTFSEVFYNFMLVLCHTPEEDKAETNYSSNFTNRDDLSNRESTEHAHHSKKSSKSITTDRISFFLSAFRRLLPELADHFDEEDVLCGIGGDEWILYWIKWLGAKVWDKRDRARIWDIHLGWRPNDMKMKDEIFMQNVMKACQLGDISSPASLDSPAQNASLPSYLSEQSPEDASTPTLAPTLVLNNRNNCDSSASGLNSPTNSHISSVDSLSSLVSDSFNSQANSSATVVPGSDGTGIRGGYRGNISPLNSTTNNNRKAEVVVNLAQLESEIGPDPFWTAGSVLFDNEASSPTNYDTSETTLSSVALSTEDTSSNHSCSSSSSSSSVASMDPLTEHLFFCLALLKSKSMTLHELDQSEIRGLLGKLFRSKDIEGLVVEACEMWRTWEYEEEGDEDE